MLSSCSKSLGTRALANVTREFDTAPAIETVGILTFPLALFHFYCPREFKPALMAKREVRLTFLLKEVTMTTMMTMKTTTTRTTMMKTMTTMMNKTAMVKISLWSLCLEAYNQWT